MPLMGGGAEVGGCSSVHMAELKSFQRTSFWLVVSLCGVYINNLWAFLLAGSHYQPQRLHQRQTCHSGSSHKDMKIYRVCLSAQGQTEGLRLSALLGEAADLAAAAATESTAGSTYTSVSSVTPFTLLCWNTDINVAPSHIFFHVENQWPQSQVWQCSAGKINQCSLISRAQLP